LAISYHFHLTTYGGCRITHSHFFHTHSHRDQAVQFSYRSKKMVAEMKPGTHPSFPTSLAHHLHAALLTQSCPVVIAFVVITITATAVKQDHHSQHSTRYVPFYIFYSYALRK
jgi:hypothetical protein